MSNEEHAPWKKRRGLKEGRTRETEGELLKKGEQERLREDRRTV